LEDISEKSRTSTDSTAYEARRKRAQVDVYKKQLTAIQQTVILAMIEIAGGATRELHIRIARIAAYAKLGERTVQRALWGDHRSHPDKPKPRGKKGEPEPECPFCKGLVQMRVLQPLSPANWKTRSPATYRLNIEILDDCAAVRHYLDQRTLQFPRTTPPLVQPLHKRPPDLPLLDPAELPMDRRCSSSGSPVTHPASHGRGDRRPTVAGPGDPRSGDPVTHGRTDSKAIDSHTVDSTSGGFSKNSPGVSDSQPKDLAKKLCERIAFPATQSNAAAVSAALEAVRRQNRFDSYREAYDWLMPRAAKAQSEPWHNTRRYQFDRFFFEDGFYNSVDPRPDAQIRAEFDAHMAMQQRATAMCDACGGCGVLHQDPNVSGPRLIACPKCRGA
jgi:hypothetical protein